ncbi:MAG: sigma 54-interacting transcriptional regulator [Myxococcota bacterium]|jgi:DNA-binding NtrC family response regulator|nr:sigma 54-interacting transcriptional regulator [Myxococcota bacterium]
MRSQQPSTTPASDSTLPRPVPDPALADCHAVTVVFSPDRRVLGRVVRAERRVLQLGRSPQGPGLAFEDPLASRVHASLHPDHRSERHLLRDEGSRNGTQCNGEEVSELLLAPGDLIRLGDTLLRYGHFDLEVVGWSAPDDGLLRGRSLGLRRLLDEIRQVAPTDLPVLIEGETGTGKELVARELHRQSGRSGEFVAVNCAAIPAELVESELFGHKRGAFSGATRDQTGLVRASAGGTLFLDEVGELAPAFQAKLLRALEERAVRPVGASRAIPVDVRILAATNRDLDEEVRHGLFRADLLARLAGWRVRVPPLRDRPEDLLPVVEAVIREQGAGRAYELSGDFVERLALHRWPMNVRELIGVVRRALVVLPEGGRLELAQLPEALRRERRTADAEVEAALPARGQPPSSAALAALLRHFVGNVSEIAEYTGKERAQVYRWLRRYGFRLEDFRRRS